MLIIIAITLFCVYVLYHYLVINSALLLYDDSILVFPMKSVKSFAEYFHGVENHFIFDRQPLRDLTYWIEYQIYFKTGYFNTHMTNVLFWLALIAACYSLAKYFLRDEKMQKLYVLILAAHPLPIVCVAWTASRKHLASVLFVVLATSCFLYARGRIKWLVGSGLLFVCSLLFQPIHVLWPFVIPLFWKFDEHVSQALSKKKMALFFGVNALSSFVVTLWNYQYYTSPKFLQFIGTPKFGVESFESIGVRFAVLGRYFLNIVFPFFVTPASYDSFSPANLLGFVALMVFILSFHRQLLNRSLWPWLFLAFIGIALMTVRLTIHPGWDTYALLCLCILTMVLLKLFGRYLTNLSVCAFMILGLLSISSGYVRSFYSDINYWDRAEAVDPSIPNKIRLAQFLLNHMTQLERVIELLDEVKRESPGNRDLPILISNFIFKTISDPQKRVDEILRNYSPDPWFLYTLAKAYEDNKENEKALLTYTQIFKPQSPGVYFGLKIVLREVKDKMKLLCKDLDGLSDCNDIETLIPESYIESKLEAVSSNEK